MCFVCVCVCVLLFGYSLVFVLVFCFAFGVILFSLGFGGFVVLGFCLSSFRKNLKLCG